MAFFLKLAFYKLFGILKTIFTENLKKNCLRKKKEILVNFSKLQEN